MRLLAAAPRSASVAAAAALTLAATGCGSGAGRGEERPERRIERQVAGWAQGALRLGAATTTTLRATCPELDPAARESYACTITVRGRDASRVALPVTWEAERRTPRAPAPVVFDVAWTADHASDLPGLQDALLTGCAGPQVRAVRAPLRVSCRIQTGSATSRPRPIVLRIDRSGSPAADR